MPFPQTQFFRTKLFLPLSPSAEKSHLLAAWFRTNWDVTEDQINLQACGEANLIQHLRLHLLEDWSQRRTRNVIRDNPGQTVVCDEEGTKKFSHAVSRHRILTDVGFPSLDQDFQDGEKMEEHEDPRGPWEWWGKCYSFIWPVFSNSSLLKVPNIGEVAGGNTFYSAENFI